MTQHLNLEVFDIFFDIFRYQTYEENESSKNEPGHDHPSSLEKWHKAMELPVG